MIQTLADLQPVMLVGIIIVMYTLETFIPYLAKPVNKRQHDIHNFILSFISFMINGLLSVAVLYVVVYTTDHHFGLLNMVQWPRTIEIIAAVLLMDFGSYCFHNLLHKVPFLWRFHRVHHSDLNLNTSSSLRFHPIDTMLSQGVYFCIAIPLFGISMTGFVVYGTIGLIFVIIQHSNIRFPGWMEKYGQYIFSTPGWHKIHHSDEQKFTDSHYGDIFTFWDRIFGTWHPVSPGQINYGLKDFAHAERQKAGFLLRSPFMDLKKEG
jgi:sterol desaturase/sphingolipid hydroxylase (fatty acid hydroxylase superfamily)